MRAIVLTSRFRRRKVKCNEQHPRCSHCERLNMECVWNTPRRIANMQSAAPLTDQRSRPPQSEASNLWMSSDWGLSQPLFGLLQQFDYDDLMGSANTQDWSQAISDPSRGMLVDSLQAVRPPSFHKSPTSYFSTDTRKVAVGKSWSTKRRYYRLR